MFSLSRLLNLPFSFFFFTLGDKTLRLMARGRRGRIVHDARRNRHQREAPVALGRGAEIDCTCMHSWWQGRLYIRHWVHWSLRASGIRDKLMGSRGCIIRS
ncbi:hypothetical protein BO70DRAFT_203327 [Aspergillus heteromorphus CBS 117.55]|uniref:Secreted protein n=1 Tax=Aspergillus heteromorphus CBS 117.55 TaxID=1448321 RepID=A0A317WSE5_9EURO|nr:uncharacterized protein BO70DRAFT_203327 [Aspergillus heteromorphus CBS 117.55]PWY87788.1 hypothetical protein BO70DRAFT_203327 [Aspergillus heteromorphus CBS 117.55]